MLLGIRDNHRHAGRSDRRGKRVALPQFMGHLVGDMPIVTLLHKPLRRAG